MQSGVVLVRRQVRGVERADLEVELGVGVLDQADEVGELWTSAMT